MNCEFFVCELLFVFNYVLHALTKMIRRIIVSITEILGGSHVT